MITIFNSLREKKRIKAWRKLKYEKSIDHQLALMLEKYNFNPLKVIVWYADLENEFILFQTNQKYYQLKNNKITEVDQDKIWHKKIKNDKS